MSFEYDRDVAVSWFNVTWILYVRWRSIYNAYWVIVLSRRNLFQMSFRNYGADVEKIKPLCRYGLTTIYNLSFQVKVQKEDFTISQ